MWNMSQSSRIHRTLLAAGTSAIVCLTASQLAAAQLNLEPPARVTTVGSQVKLTIWISGLGDLMAPSLGAYDFTLNYDPATLRYDSYSLGDFLAPFNPSVSSPPAVDDINGSINLFEISTDDAIDLNATQPSTFNLASIWFSAIGVGSSSLNLSSVILADGNGDPLDANLTGARITVEPRGGVIPEAGTQSAAVLLGAFAMGHTIQRRRKQATASN